MFIHNLIVKDKRKMIGIAVKSKKALKEYIGKSINHLIIETSMFGREYSENCSICYVGPCPYTNRKFFGQITVKNGILTKCK
jgi:hypothetical protein